MNLDGIKNIIFDFGGVIVDVSREQAVESFKKIGVSNADEIIGTYKQTGIFLELEEGKISRNDFYDALRESSGGNMTNEEIDSAWLGFFLPLQQERVDFLLELRKKYNLFLLSNTNPIVMSWANSPNFTPAGKPLSDYFDKLYLSYQMGVIKPEKIIFEQVIQDANIKPEESLFIDDGKSNVEAGKSCGMRTYQPKEREDYRYIFLDTK